VRFNLNQKTVTPLSFRL